MTSGTSLRRLLVLPPVLLLHVVLLLATPVALPVSAVVSLVTRSTRPLRSVVLVASVAALELATLQRMLRLRAAHASAAQWQELLRWAAAAGEATIRRVLDVRVELEPGSASPADVAAAEGLVVLARHAGPGDTVLVAWLLVVHHALRLQVVLKRLLRVVPAIDLAGDALPFCFVGVRRGAARAGVARLAGGVGHGDALLLFPEGENFSAARWRRARARLARSGALERVRRLRRNAHTLPPHAGGVVAALTSAPRASVLLVAHSGLGEHGDARPWWRLPVHQPVVMRTLLVPAAEVPRDPTAVPAWLDEMWTCVDTWVEGHAAVLDHAAPDGADGQPVTDSSPG